jgi:hypothetical protein
MKKLTFPEGEEVEVGAEDCVIILRADGGLEADIPHRDDDAEIADGSVIFVATMMLWILGDQQVLDEMSKRWNDKVHEED